MLDWIGGKLVGMHEPGELLWHLHSVGMGGILLKLAPFFLIGALLVTTPKERFRPIFACIGLVVACLFYRSEYGIVALWATLPYAVLTTAYHSPKTFNDFGKYGDFSYGVYLYAFPVQQTLSYFGITTWWLHLLISAVVTLLLAVLSWKFIEFPALRMKRRNTATPAAPNSPVVHDPVAVSR
jgi:peptidoglycan/LPS O-acetylase OafA/YrhL